MKSEIRNYISNKGMKQCIDEQTKERTSERTSQRASEWSNEWASERIDERASERMNETQNSPRHAWLATWIRFWKKKYEKLIQRINRFSLNFQLGKNPKSYVVNNVIISYQFVIRKALHDFYNFGFVFYSTNVLVKICSTLGKKQDYPQRINTSSLLASATRLWNSVQH